MDGKTLIYGDWVKTPKGKGKVEKIDPSTWNTTLVTVDIRGVRHAYADTSLEAISLTPDLLKKNG